MPQQTSTFAAFSWVRILQVGGLGKVKWGPELCSAEARTRDLWATERGLYHLSYLEPVGNHNAASSRPRSRFVTQPRDSNAPGTIPISHPVSLVLSVVVVCIVLPHTVAAPGGNQPASQWGCPLT
ncbi:hypothetical protein ElyMa_004463600 [Elysia marginata]|uniref:Uncharacterized protein n=1 Tax=Elysia marginata TaxID=1093978 RepID=A0AAV4HHL2_9GAST|nr:hypothetical protein ElyMa_004463600 [Elysia marginata]